MDFSTMMESCRSCRAYQNQPVSREDLLKIVEAGRLTPSACNSQPWKFIVVDKPQAKALLCDALVVKGGHSGCSWREQVPAFLILCETKAKVVPFVQEYYGDTQHFASGDIGAATMNMCHQAMELGLSTCIIGVNDQEKMERHLASPPVTAQDLRWPWAMQPRGKLCQARCVNPWKKYAASTIGNVVSSFDVEVTRHDQNCILR